MLGKKLAVLFSVVEREMLLILTLNVPVKINSYLLHIIKYSAIYTSFVQTKMNLTLILNSVLNVILLRLGGRITII